MPADSHASAHISEIAPIIESPPGEEQWLPVRHFFGVRAFGVNAWVAREAGDRVIEEHDEVSGGAADHEELYLVTEGHATFVVDGETIDAPRGTFVHVGDPRVRRSAAGRDAGTTVLAIGAAPGVAFQVSPWERRQVESARG
jgi:hypothetical protein